MSDTIFITGIVIHARHGVMEHETEVGQRFIIDLELSVDLSESSRTDHLSDTVSYSNVVATATAAFKNTNYKLLERAGIARENIVLDPGIGFGKTPEQSMQAIARLDSFKRFGMPLLVGASRKRFINTVSPSEPHQRLGGSIAAHLMATQRGARMIRAHDVAETVQALRVAAAIREQE